MPLPQPALMGNFPNPKEAAKKYREALTNHLRRNGGIEDDRSFWLRANAQEAERQYHRKNSNWLIRLFTPPARFIYYGDK